VNQKIRAVIVDDELLAREALLVMLCEDAEMEAAAACRNGKEAVEAIREHSPDIVFMDIQMPEMDGFQVIEQIGVQQMPVTIFVTAYDKYALRAFDANAVDYLLKPFDHDRFQTALEKAKTTVRQRKLQTVSESLYALLRDMKSNSAEPGRAAYKEEQGNPGRNRLPDRVAVRSSGRIYFLSIEEIDWIQASDDYLSLHGGGKTHLIRETMGNFYDKLDRRKFVRIHRSAIVNIERIKDMQPLRKGEYVINLTSGARLKSSRGYRAELQPLIDEAR
jgi:two-component system LytT family response regulator